MATASSFVMGGRRRLGPLPYGTITLGTIPCLWRPRLGMAERNRCVVNVCEAASRAENAVLAPSLYIDSARRRPVTLRRAALTNRALS